MATKHNLSHRWFLLVFNVFLLILILHQLKITWQEYQIYLSGKKVVKEVDKLIENNRRLQEELQTVNDPTQLEVKAREKLLLGPSEEKFYLIKKEIYHSPPLKEIIRK